MLVELMALLAQAAGAASPPVTAQAEQRSVITNPDWRRRPSGDDLLAVFPRTALSHGRNGRATITCTVTVDGALSGCFVVSEAPAGEGFGAAALALVPQFQMRPQLVDGQPVGGASVTIPIRFSTGGSFGAMMAPPVQVRALVRPTFVSAPSRADVARAAPAGAVGSGTLRCMVRADRRLRNCSVIAEEPRRGPFGEAALSLADAFEIAPRPPEEGSPEGARLDLRVPFGGETPPYVSAPRWYRAPEAAEVQAALEPLARAAADRTAGATVDCEVAARGELRGCRVLRSTSVEAGIAAAALAGRFALSPWTEAGGSWVGARIRLPLRYVAD